VNQQLSGLIVGSDGEVTIVKFSDKKILNEN
jgi:hypothetical protein